jgi:hypothetical protein
MPPPNNYDRCNSIAGDHGFFGLDEAGAYYTLTSLDLTQQHRGGRGR